MQPEIIFNLSPQSVCAVAVRAVVGRGLEEEPSADCPFQLLFRSRKFTIWSCHSNLWTK